MLAVPFWMVVWPFVPVEGVLSVPEDGASLVPEPPPLGVELVDHLVFVDGDLVSVRDTVRSGKGGYQLIRSVQW